MNSISDFVSSLDPLSLRRHVDGGIYRVVGESTHADTGVHEIIYEHLHPFTRSLWTRPADQFSKRFAPISPEDARMALHRPAADLQLEIASNKSARRASEALAQKLTAPPKLHCIGFMFDPCGSQVALIRKLNPAWQRGKLNGIGGKTEPGETSVESMVREFKEEAGVQTSPADWTLFARLLAPEFEAHVFRSFSSLALDCHSATAEEVLLLPVQSDRIAFEGLSGLQGLVLAALDPDVPFHDILYRASAEATLSSISKRLG